MKNRNIISSLEVSDFRGLEGVRTLEFESADIVLFLGLNGFGKTSVFDSIEWCLTGKLGRYEQYTESGRKQDFGREKEVLRNKYATNPNTYAKVTLENGITFGRRVLSGDTESDYSMGSIYEGCEYGLDTITKEAIKEELANSYFSATHILSQETINHFVTSKKPEERYQALSINFGTAIFTPFESNIQVLLNKIVESEKDVKKELQSKKDLINSLQSQFDFKTKNISESLDKANELIETINSLSSDIFYGSLNLKDHTISMSPNFGEYVNSSTSRANLQHSNLKKRIVGLKYLKDNITTWSDDNSELNRIETSLSDDRKLMDRIKSIQDTIVTSKNEISSLEQMVKPLKVQKSKIIDAIENLPHYINAAKKILLLESEMQNRSAALSAARENAVKLEQQLDDRKRLIDHATQNLSGLKGILKYFEKNQDFLSEYDSDHEAITEKIAATSVALESLRNKLTKLRVIIAALDAANSLISLRGFIKNPDCQEFLDNGSIKNLIEILDEIDLNSKAIDQYNADEKRLTDEEAEQQKLFSESRQLLSRALTQIVEEKDDNLCPVCDTQHKTKDLIYRIKNKLGVDESAAVTELHSRLLGVRAYRENAQIRADQLRGDAKKMNSAIIASLTGDQASVLREESQAANAIQELVERKKKIEQRYEEIYTRIDSLVETKVRGYFAVVELLSGRITEFTDNLNFIQEEREGLQKNSVENELLLKETLQFNNSNLSEIAALKDTKYTSVQKFLEQNGMKSDLDHMEGHIKELLINLELELKKHLDAIKSQEAVSEKAIRDKEQALMDRTEESLRNEALAKEEQLGKLRTSLARYLHRLSELEILPSDYTIQHIEQLEKATEKELDIQERKFSALEELSRLIEAFRKFNLDSNARTKIDNLTSDKNTLSEREVQLRKAKDNVSSLKKSYPEVLKNLIKENLDVGLFNKIYELLNPHRRFKIIDFNVDVNHNRIGINFNAKESKISGRPEFLFSSAQLNTFGICIFLSMALRQNWLNLDTILIDDPIQNLDDINILSFIDFLRSLLDSNMSKKQIILSTHDERFYDLMLKKFKDYNLKSFRFESYGKLRQDIVAGIKGDVD